MKITVTEKRTYLVPQIIESEVQLAIQLDDKEYLEELLENVSEHGTLQSIETVDVVEVPGS